MSQTLQYVLAAIIVGAALFAAVRTIVRTLNDRKTALTACVDCKLADICQKPEKNSAKKCDDKVAHNKK